MNTPDVVIAGGGVIGVSVALELARRHVRVTVLERGEFMREASWAAAGMLSPAPDSPASIPLVPLARASLQLYPQYVADVEEASGRQTRYRDGGAIEVLFRGDAVRELSTLVALHHGLGLACEPLPLDELSSMEPGVGRAAIAAAMLPNECSVEPRALGGALCEAAARSGVELRSGMEVAALVVEGSRCLGVKTNIGEFLRAAHVVLAAGCWSSHIPEASRYARTGPVRGQMVALRHRGAPIRHVLRSERAYVVPRELHTPQTLVAGSTLENAGYEKQVTSGGVEKILSAVNELAPELEHAEMVETWCGLRPGTPDQLPILGAAELEGLVFATGHYRNGILLAPVTAKLVAEWITERRTSLAWDAFSPLRFARTSVGDPASV